MKVKEQRHIIVSEKTKKKLDNNKIHNRETYDDVIQRLLKNKNGNNN